MITGYGLPMNFLDKETSPYLKQHRHNPVKWYPWGDEAWRIAREEDKLVLISIGYSACHWCHVMERESFEDEVTAAIMNDHFVCIKVDREERPDVDQVYMEAVQVMNGSGGWPLNCFALPDGRPVFGGTYFRNADWKKNLLALADYYKSNKAGAADYATKLVTGMRNAKFSGGEGGDYSMEKIDSLVLAWQNYFDLTEGGQDREPKFPLPVNIEFLIQFGAVRKNKFILNFVHLTLHKMAWGGIYDQAGGGFARYSVDRYWHVPHFEKMLYDNAQLISLYSHAYHLTRNSFYKEVVDRTIGFVTRELANPGGGFYSALDADSEGVEGKFYTWSKDQFVQAVSKETFSTVNFIEHLIEFYSITERGNWTEEETNILNRKQSISDFCKPKSLDESIFSVDLSKANAALLEARAFRIRPGLDDKILTSWNAMMIKALADAYMATEDISYLDAAQKSYAFLKTNLFHNGRLFHSFHPSRSVPDIDAFLDDYVFLAEAAIQLYQCTFTDAYLLDARDLVTTVLANFKDGDSALFYYSGHNTMEELFMRKHEFYDNVIPSSNAILASVLYKLSFYFEEPEYSRKATQMVQSVRSKFAGYPGGFGQWLQVQLLMVNGLKTVCICADDPGMSMGNLRRNYFSNVIFAGGQSSTVPIMQGKKTGVGTRFFICSESGCMPPLANVSEVLSALS
jgi:uncharacterized protein YyaL (SSP411 family)